MYYKSKKNIKGKINVCQNDDNSERYDYGKSRVDIASGLIGENEKIRDSR